MGNDYSIDSINTVRVLNRLAHLPTIISGVTVILVGWALVPYVSDLWTFLRFYLVLAGVGIIGLGVRKPHSPSPPPPEVS